MKSEKKRERSAEGKSLGVFTMHENTMKLLPTLPENIQRRGKVGRENRLAGKRAGVKFRGGGDRDETEVDFFRGNLDEPVRNSNPPK